MSNKLKELCIKLHPCVFHFLRFLSAEFLPVFSRRAKRILAIFAHRRSQPGLQLISLQQREVTKNRCLVVAACGAHQEWS